MNDVEDIFNYYSDMVSPLFYMEKTGALNVRIWGGTILVNRSQVTVADTNLTLTDNATNYIVYDYLTNIVSVNTTGVGLVKVTVTVTSGVIGTPTYNVIKESYADPFVPDVTLVAPVIQNNTFAYADSTGSANAYEVSYTPAPTAYVAGQKFFFKANFQNTGSATLNVNWLGAKTIKKLDGATDLQSTDIANGAMVEVLYDGTNFQLTSIPQTIKNNDVTQLTSVNNLTTKANPVWADLLLLWDSAASFANKKIFISDIRKSNQIQALAWEDISSWQAVGINTVRDKYTFDGVTIDSAKWTTNGTVTQNWYIEVTSTTNIGAFVNQIKSISTYTDSIEINADLYVQMNSIYSLPNIADLTLYFNATNHIKFQLYINPWSWTSYIQITSTKNWSVEYTAQSSNQWASNGFSSLARTIRATYDPSTWYVNLYYLSWWLWVQVWAQFTTTFGSSTPYNFVFTQENTATSASQLLSRLDNFFIWYLTQTKQIYLCNANDKYSLNFNGFSIWSFTKWSQATIDVSWINSQQSWLTVWEIYYLSNTSWSISTTPWTYVVGIWKSISATEIQVNIIDGTKPEETRTVTASPSIIRNGNQTSTMRITWWTVSLVQYSRDGINYTTIGTATNIQVTLWWLDYIKITYSVLPSVIITNI